MTERSTKILTCLKFIGKPSVFFTQKKFVFVISHMRGRTTLISHILGSSPQIVGSTELHMHYRNSFDAMQVKEIRMKEKGFNEAEYICDKLLHNYISLDVSRFPQAKYIFVLRNPKDTLSSLLKRHLEQHGEESITELSHYYKERLIRMEEIWDSLSADQRFYIDSDSLVDEPEIHLKRLTSFLNLQKPLSSQYEITETTGVSGRGDMSNNIKAGKIVKTEANLSLHHQTLLSTLYGKSEQKLYKSLQSKFSAQCSRSSHSTLREL